MLAPFRSNMRLMAFHCTSRGMLLAALSLGGLALGCVGGKDTDDTQETEVDTDVDTDTDTDTDTTPPDTTPPTIALTAPLEGETTSGTLQFAAEASDDVGVMEVVFTVDGDEIAVDGSEPWEGSFDTTTVLNGNYGVTASASDAAGNQAEASATFWVENEGGLGSDTIRIINPVDGASVCGNLTVEAAVSTSDVDVTFSLDGTDFAMDSTEPYQWDWNTEAISNGSHALRATAVDASGASAQNTITVRVDNSGASCDNLPSVAFTTPVAGAWLYGDIHMAADASDDVGVIALQFLVDNGLLFEDTSVPYQTTFPSDKFDEGPHSLKAIAVDSSDQTAETRITVNVDRTAPIVLIDAPSDGSELEGTVTIEATATDNFTVATVDLSIDGASVATLTGSPWEYDWDTTLSDWGEHTITATATDLAGHSSWDQIDISVDNPPQVTILSPSSGDTLEGRVEIEVNATDDGYVDEVSLYIDGSLEDRDSSSPWSLDWDTCDSTTGSHTLRVVAEDSGGNTAEDSISVTVDQPLEVELVEPGSGTMDTTEDLIAWVASDETVSQVVFDLDGTTIARVTSSTTVWECDAPCGCDQYATTWDTSSTPQGSYTLTATVTDSLGDTATDSVSVSIDYDRDGDGYDATAYGGSDCDDTDASIHPGATELCDRVDQDCDGDVDEDFDVDGDGAYSAAECSTGTDCDDTDATINPSATESCDGIDNDCDGFADLSGGFTTESATFGASSSDDDITSMFIGNVYVPSYDTTLQSFQAWMNPSGTVNATFAVYRATTLNGTYSLVHSTSRSVSGGTTWYDSGTLGVTLEGGYYYLIGVGSDGTTAIYYDASPDLSESSGMLPRGFGSDATSATPSSIGNNPSTSFLIYQELTVDVLGPEDADHDGDGISLFCGDCDDTDASSYPGATEVCDEADNDCDGTVDESVDADGDGYGECDDCDDGDPSVTDGWAWYRDADGDGYGDASYSEIGCTAEEVSADEDWWFVADDTDCDDTDSSIHPGATERCDGYDEDCDGVADNGFDLDGDGHWSAFACSFGDDCDDSDATINPSATEICDGIDNDCDGTVDASGAAGGSATADFGDSSSNLDVTDDWYGNVYYSEIDGVLESFEVYIDPNYTVYLDFDVFESTTETGTYSLIGSSSLTVDSTQAWYDSGTLDVPLVAGRYYLVGIGFDGRVEDLFYDSSADMSTQSGLQPLGYDYTTSYNPSTMSGGPAYSSRLLYQSLSFTIVNPDDTDSDGDGQTPFCGDCDDSDALIYMGASEICDAVDNDCDGYADEGFDADGDGWASCLECDDSDPTVNPDEVEVCNGVDDDCSGVIDDDAIDGTAYYQDADGDGFGDASVTATWCSATTGWVLSSTDCDDGSAAIHPGATEVCDEADNDCDGSVDEGFDGDGDGWASCVDCDDSSAAIHPGATESCDGIDNDCDGITDALSSDIWATPSFGADSTSATISNDFYGNIYLAGEDTTLGSFEAWLNPDGSVTAYFRVYESTTATGTYSLVASNSAVISGGNAFYDSGSIDLDLIAGHYYLLGVGTVGTSAYFYASSPTLTAGSGLYPLGYDYSSSSYYPSSLSGGASTSRLYYQRITVGGVDPSDRDDDGDGYTEFCSDCDDHDIFSYPGATEACDAADNDCDGTVDEGFDTDGDGWLSTASCGPVIGGDCDDTRAESNPDADEYCNGHDDNCDGTVDEDAALDATMWYRDVDGDGYGRDLATWVACSQPIGYAADGTDCDDDDASAHPGATEDCDGVDNDCDGTADESFTDSDGDGWASCVDCDETDSSVNPGAYDICEDSIDQDCSGADRLCGYSGSIDLGLAMMVKRWGESSSDYAGHSVAGGGDVNGDGYADVLVGAYGDDDGGSTAGAAYLLYGPQTVDGSLAIGSVKFWGEDASDYAGGSVAFAGDVNADGYDDVLISAHLDDDGGTSAGAAYLLYGPLSSSIDLYRADAKLVGETSDDYAGHALCGAGDVNADGFDDFLVGAYRAGSSYQGYAYLVMGPVTGDLDLSMADGIYQGDSSSDYFGHAVAGGVDVDGDGYDDIFGGSDYADDGGTSSGTSYLFYGPATGTIGISAADSILIGEDSSDYSGTSVALSPDLDGDGHGDLIISAIGDDDGGTDAGAVYIVFGPPPATLDLSLADVKLTGPDERYGVGTALDGSGDIDGDGQLDLIIGASGAETGGSDSGSTFVLYGPITADWSLASADVELIGEDSGDHAGISAAFAGDMDGDGYGDLIIGADYDDTSSNSGAAYIVLFSAIP
jgi:hypothetical protein